jgi:filamentous hemagglutinin
MRAWLSAIGGTIWSAITAMFGERITIDERRLAHIFRPADGHFPADTTEARRVLLRVANDPATWLGTDRFGTIWAAEMMPDGSQIWVQIRDGLITNGGVNTTHRVFDGLTALPGRPAQGSER